MNTSGRDSDTPLICVCSAKGVLFFLAILTFFDSTDRWLSLANVRTTVRPVYMTMIKTFRSKSKCHHGKRFEG